MDLPTALRRLGTLAIKRAGEYRAPFDEDPEEDGTTAFVQSGSYSIYSSLTELHLLVNALADEIDAEAIQDEIKALNEKSGND